MSITTLASAYDRIQQLNELLAVTTEKVFNANHNDRAELNEAHTLLGLFEELYVKLFDDVRAGVYSEGAPE